MHNLYASMHALVLHCMCGSVVDTGIHSTVGIHTGSTVGIHTGSRVEIHVPCMYIQTCL